MGLVLTYTVTGVFNFAHGAVGMIAAFCFYELRVTHGVPTPIAIVLVVFVVAPVTGLVAERLLRRFQGADYATSLVVTIALTVGLLGFAQKVFPEEVARNAPYLLGDHRDPAARRADLLRPHRPGRDRRGRGLRAALSCCSAPALGARMRSVVDDPELARLNGVRSVAVARCSWMIGFVPGRARPACCSRRARTSTPSCSPCSCSTPTARR